MNANKKQLVLDVLNSLEVLESNGGEEAYILVENNKENREALNNVGVTTETINKYGDEETFCILALAFSEGYCDLYDGGKLIKFDKSIELKMNEKGSVILFKHNEDVFLSLSENNGYVSTFKLDETQLSKIKDVIA